MLQASNVTETEPPAPAQNAAPPPPPAPAPVELHPRKRKMKQSREQANAQAQQQNADNGDSSAEARGEVHPHDQPITNCYKLFMNIRQQVRVSLSMLTFTQCIVPSYSLITHFFYNTVYCLQNNKLTLTFNN